jgi:polyhydroxyalkanoate synthesis regulator protein
MAKSDQPVTIKKYANRRLYNTGTSTYVTLEDLAAMVKDFVDYGKTRTTLEALESKLEVPR